MPTAVVSIAAVADSHEGVLPAVGYALVSRAGGDLNQALSVNYAVSGTATPGVDYQALAGSVEIPAGQVSAAIAIRPIDDPIPEFPESVYLALLADPAYQLGDASQATVHIRNQETVTVAAGANLTFTLGFVVTDCTEPPTLTAENLPPGASFTIVHSEAHPEAQPPNAHTFGQFSWTPALEQVGSYEVGFAANVPSCGISSTTSIIITVVPPNQPPTVDLGGSTDFQVDSESQFFTWNVADASGLSSVGVTVTKDGNEILLRPPPAASSTSMPTDWAATR